MTEIGMPLASLIARAVAHREMEDKRKKSVESNIGVLEKRRIPVEELLRMDEEGPGMTPLVVEKVNRTDLCPQSSYHPNNRGQNVQETCEDCVRTDYETCVNNPNRRKTK